MTCILGSQETDKVVWYSHLFNSFLQFVMIHKVKIHWIKMYWNWELSQISEAACCRSYHRYGNVDLLLCLIPKFYLAQWFVIINGFSLYIGILIPININGNYLSLYWILFENTFMLLSPSLKKKFSCKAGCNMIFS